MEQELPAQIQAELDQAAQIEAAIAAEQAALNAPEDTTKPEAEPAPVVQAQPEPEPQPTAQPEAKTDDFEAKYHALQGKFNAEVPRYAEQLRKANESILILQRQVDALSQAPEKHEEVQTVTSEDEEAFGSDLLEVVRKVAKQEAAAAAKAARVEVQKVASKVDSVEQAQAATQGDRFMADIAKAVPDWETINVDDRWLNWLGEYSPETGAPRQAALDAASQSLDSNRAIALFNAFKKTLPAPAPEQKPTSKAQQELQSQVAPAKTAATATTATAEKIWTGKEYESAFDVRNSQTMTQQEIDALQAEAERAYVDGRIQW